MHKYAHLMHICQVISSTPLLLSTDYKNHRLTVGSTVLPLKGLVPNGRTLILRVLAERPCGPRSPRYFYIVMC